MPERLPIAGAGARRWVPPSIDDIAASSLPDWLTGDADLVVDMCGADDMDSRPLWDFPSNEIDLSQITEMDLERQLAEKDEEIRLTHVCVMGVLATAFR